MYKIERMPHSLEIGYVGEKNFRPVEIDMTAWMEKMPEGVPSIVCIRPGETKDDAYIAVTTFEDNVLTWVPSDADLGVMEGEGMIQVWLEEEDNSSLTKRGKSIEVITKVKDSVSNPGADTPAPQQAFLEQMTSLKNATVSAAEDAEDAKDAAEQAAEDAEAAVVHQPYIDSTSKHWMVWDNQTEEYVDTQILAEGQQGQPGDPTQLIDDTAGEGTTGKTWSANKLDEEITDVKSAIQGITDGKETFSRYGTFVNGNLAAGVVYTNVKYRVTTNTIMTFTRALEITIAEGFRFLWNVFVNGSYSSNSDWQTGTVIIPANTSIKVLIARVTEDETETADINTFLSKIVFNTVIQDELENLEKDVTALGTEIDQKTDFVEFVTDPNFEDSTNIASDTTWQDGYYRSTAGNATSSQYTTNYTCSDFIPVKSGEKYRLYVNGTCTVITEYYTKAKNDGTEVSLGVVSQGASVDITVPDGKTFLALNCLMNHSNKVNVIHRLTQYDNEKNISFPRLVYGTQEWIGKKIVNFGDSIFDNGQTINEDISTYLTQLTGATVLNCAFGGCRMGAHTASQFDAFSMYKLVDAISTGDWTAQDEALNGENIPGNFATTLARLKAIDFSTVDIVTISYGTNDFAGGLGLGGSSKYFTDWALNYSIQTLLTAYPNLHIFVCLPIYRVWLNGTTFDEDSNTKEVTTWTGGDIKHKLTDFIEAERDVCKANQIPVIDNYYELGVNKWNWLTYYPSDDGTHPKIEGRKLIAKHIASVIW